MGTTSLVAPHEVPRIRVGEPNTIGRMVIISFHSFALGSAHSSPLDYYSYLAGGPLLHPIPLFIPEFHDFLARDQPKTSQGQPLNYREILVGKVLFATLVLKLVHGFQLMSPNPTLIPKKLSTFTFPLRQCFSPQS